MAGEPHGLQSLRLGNPTLSGHHLVPAQPIDSTVGSRKTSPGACLSLLVLCRMMVSRALARRTRCRVTRYLRRF
jgi:hypothetical protein